MDVYVCVGSSCHLKGSYRIIELMKSGIEKHKLSDTIDLKASFCLGKCTDGVSIKVDEEIISGVSAENFAEIFEHHILRRLEE